MLTAQVGFSKAFTDLSALENALGLLQSSLGGPG